MTQTDAINLLESATGYPIGQIEIVELKEDVTIQDALLIHANGGALLIGVDPKKKWILKRVED